MARAYSAYNGKQRAHLLTHDNNIFIETLATFPAIYPVFYALVFHTGSRLLQHYPNFVLLWLNRGGGNRVFNYLRYQRGPYI